MAENALVEVDELIAYMSNINMTPSQKVAAETILAGVQSELEKYVNRPLQPLQIREVARVDRSGYLNLRCAPIHKIISLQPVDQTFLPTFLFPAPVLSPLVPADGITRVPEDMIGDLVNYGNPLVVPGGIYVGNIVDAFYSVEYIAGYLGWYDESLKLDIMRVAAREVEQMHDDTHSLLQDNATDAKPRDTRPIGWTDAELKKWDRIRRRVMAT